MKKINRIHGETNCEPPRTFVGQKTVSLKTECPTKARRAPDGERRSDPRKGCSTFRNPGAPGALGRPLLVDKRAAHTPVPHTKTYFFPSKIQLSTTSSSIPFCPLHAHTGHDLPPSPLNETVVSPMGFPRSRTLGAWVDFDVEGLVQVVSSKTAS